MSLRKIAIAAAGIGAAATILAAGSPAASAATAGAGPQVQHNASASISCAGAWFENSYGGGNGQFFYADESSPHELLANTASTNFCAGPGSSGNVAHVAQDDSNLCLSVESGGGGGARVDETTCSASSNPQVVHFIWNNSYGGPYAEGELQFVNDGKNCIYQDGRDSAVDVEPCNPNVTGDEWITTW